MLVRSGNGQRRQLVIRGARVLDPPRGSTPCSTSASTAGVIAAIGERSTRTATAWSTAAGLVLAPAFVDPHVHLRTPGREDEETIASGTAAAAAGGYCAILAMPNTDPGRRLGRRARRRSSSRRRRRGRGAGRLHRRDHEGPGGHGADRDGRARRRRRRRRSPTTAARSSRPALMRRALQYNAVTGRRIALHCEEPTLTRGGHMHEGAVSAELGFGGYPSVAESVDGRARPLARRATRSGRCTCCTSRPASRSSALRRAQARRRRRDRRGRRRTTSCLTDEAVRSLDANVKMNPPLRSRTTAQR